MFNIFKRKQTNKNAMFTLQPYRYLGQWVFDDETRGLQAEAFVCGMSEIIDDVLVANGIDPVDVQDGFRLTFSTTPLPDHTHSLTWDRKGEGGNWYRCDQTKGLAGCALLCSSITQRLPRSCMHELTSSN